MADETNATNAEKTELSPRSRRAMLTTAAQVAVTAPAVALLLNATSKSAFAQITIYEGPVHILDDFTFGNSEEDIDAFRFGSNFNPFNQQANQDDHIP
jgi:hypothetical protein